MALRSRSYKNAGVLADCLADWTRAETVEARVACLRFAELANLVHSALTQRPGKGRR